MFDISTGTHTEVWLDDGHAFIGPRGETRLVPQINGMRMGPADLCELLRIACGTDAKVLEVLAHSMKFGHRFRMDGEPDRWRSDDNEPF